MMTSRSAVIAISLIQVAGQQHGAALSGQRPEQGADPHHALGSRPLTGSSSISTGGSPSSAARCRAAGSCRGRTRRPPAGRAAEAHQVQHLIDAGAADPLLSARHSRWLRALRPPWNALASSSAPT